MADITPLVSLNGELTLTASLNGELAMPEKVWMQGPPGPQGPQGDPGAAATVRVGTVTTGEPGTDAIVTNSGTESAAVLDFTIPRGETGAGGGGVTTLHINVTAVNVETMEATFTADKTPAEMQQASANGPVWCVISFPAGILSEEALSVGAPPAWYGSDMAFGGVTAAVHEDDGSNKLVYAVRQGLPDTWILDLSAFGG